MREANLPLAGMSGLNRSLQRLGYRRLYPRADAVLCAGNKVANGLSRLAPRMADKSVTIHNPVDVTRIRQSAMPLVRKSGEGLRLVAIGRLSRQIGFDRLLDMLPSFTDTCHLQILGDGDEMSALREQVARYGLESRVELVGYIDNPWPYMADADALLLPSR